MPPPLDLAGLKKLALRLATDGPYKTLTTPIRVRILFNRAYVADTTAAKYVWEHEYYPQYYLPLSCFASSARQEIVEELKDGSGKTVARLLQLHVGDRVLQNVVSFESDIEGKAAGLAGLVKVNFQDVDQWFEEDAPIFVHPKDPFKRVDIVPSSRPVRVSVDGTVLAEASTSMHLFETSLPRRFYLPLTSVSPQYLRPSKTRTKCPYKGEAEYYDVVLEDGKQHKDIVWYYTTPTHESAAIARLVCFYNEKVDIEVKSDKGWEKLQRP